MRKRRISIVCEDPICNFSKMIGGNLKSAICFKCDFEQKGIFRNIKTAFYPVLERVILRVRYLTITCSTSTLLYQPLFVQLNFFFPFFYPSFFDSFIYFIHLLSRLPFFLFRFFVSIRLCVFPLFDSQTLLRLSVRCNFPAEPYHPPSQVPCIHVNSDIYK